jgi:hypothetical protein
MFLCMLDVEGYSHTILELYYGFAENYPFSTFVLPTLEGEHLLVQSEHEPKSQDIVDINHTSNRLKVAFKLFDENPPLKFVYDLSKLDCEVSLYFINLDKEHEFNIFTVTHSKLEPTSDFLPGVVSAYESHKRVEHSKFECRNSVELKNLSSLEREIVQNFLNTFNLISFC